ncbi:MAG: Cof-type HAD-IIB family hydrolase [Dorea sp.]
MDYQLLALDLDGTLTNSKKEITKPTFDALIDIQKAGKKVVLASGRPINGVIPLAKKLHLDEYGSYILSFNGGRITDCRTWEPIYNAFLPANVVKPVFDIAKKYTGIDILSYTATEILSGLEVNQYTELEANINKIPIIRLDDFASQVTEPGNKLLITGDPKVIELVQAELIEYFGSSLSIYCSDPFFLEIVPPGVNKASSILKLLDILSLTPAQVIGCGDGYNDIAMIRTAGLGVAMANAQPAVKESADYITKSNDEDGVLHVIDTFMK